MLYECFPMAKIIECAGVLINNERVKPQMEKIES